MVCVYIPLPYYILIKYYFKRHALRDSTLIQKSLFTLHVILILSSI